MTLSHRAERAAPDEARGLLEDAALVIRSLMRELYLSDHRVRKPEPIDGKTQWVSAESLLAAIARSVE